jgi:predicted double-glycine peptidase
MLKIPPYRQRVGSCGPASLKMVLRYYGIEITERELIRLTGCTKREGTSGRQIIRAAKKLGLKGIIRDEATFQDIKTYVLQKKIPVIVDWFSVDEGHYSVVVDITHENIYMLDPSLGYLRAMRLQEFEKVWFDFSQEPVQTKDDLILRRIIVVYKKP